ncbi:MULTISPECIES: GNAT family N-acetyltransferase [Mammaliicoccus]|uniref:GNAT family N-acetyltransferase n=1 Tax=Mammaliicoccus TaxID=2803850 RepID=UPI001EFA5F6C|nr:MULTISPECIES: GNAT family N-acetyltransferase [Mammaliicoccus]MEB7780383.1 GNAT family N-acetyltransferase [Mammaliicoccus fleurettii]MEB8068812.1 GNAT family N-acetyltransferase [Mammaliicoccus fleurettii]
MNISILNVEDVNKIVPIFDEYRVYFDQQSNVDAAYDFLYNNLSNNDAVIFIAEDEEAVIGFLQLYSMLSSMKMSEMLIINDLYLTDAARGKHIGEQLMHQAFKYGKDSGYETISLETEKSNIGGNRLYTKLGMQVDDEHNYYSKEL